MADGESLERLRRAWGLCARHATALIALEDASGGGLMQACAALYLDLIEHGIRALATPGLLAEERGIRNLRAKASCPMCELSAGRGGDDAAGRDRRPELPETALEAFAHETLVHWRQFVCRSCGPNAHGPLCRVHLIGDHELGLIEEIRVERAFLGSIARHLMRYLRSIRLSERDTRTAEDQAALIEAVGWCSGWGGLLVVIGGRP